MRLGKIQVPALRCQAHITTGQMDAKVPQASWVDRSAATGGLKLPLGP